MKTEKIKEKYLHYNLDKDDVFKHQHYIIITRSGIDKIQAIENITIDYEVINCEKDFLFTKDVGITFSNLISASDAKDKVNKDKPAIKATTFFILILLFIITKKRLS